MGDPLSVVASALTVIGSGFAIAKGLNTLADGLGSAGESVRIYAKEIRIFSELLDTIRGELEKDPKHSWSRAEHLTMEILDLCKSLLEPTNQLQAKLNPLLVFYRDSPTKICQIALRIRWVFSAQEKLLRYRGFLQALTVTLNTALVTIKFIARPCNATTWYIEENLVQCIDDVRRSLNDPRRLALGGSLQPIVQALPPPDTRAAIMNGDSTLSTSPLGYFVPRRITFEAALTPQISDSDAGTNPIDDDSSNTTHDTGTSRALILPRFQEDEPNEDPETPNTNVFIEIDQKIYDAIHQTLYQQPDGTEQEMWEDLRVVSRKVLQYAEDVLRGVSQKSLYGPSRSPNFQPDALPEHVEAGSSEFRMSTKHGEIRIPSHIAQNFEISSTDDDINVVHKGDREPVSVGVPVSSLSSASDLLTLKNIDGKTYRVSHDSIRDWDDAKSFFLSLWSPPIFAAYGPDDGKETSLAAVFKEGDFLLKAQDGHYIPPRYWTQSVQPGSTVELQLSDKVFCKGMSEIEKERSEKEKVRRDAELAKFGRLESLLISQQEAKIEKEKAKKEAAEKAAQEAAEAKKRGDEDKLAKLESLILAQKDEQLKREAAEKAAADAEATKIAEEKKAVAEKAALLVEAAKMATATRTEPRGQTTKQGLPVVVQSPIAQGTPTPTDNPKLEEFPNETISGASEILLGQSSPTESSEKPKESISAKLGRLFSRKR